MLKIILLRYYKVPYQITYILTDRLNLSLIEIKEKLLEPYLIYKGYVNNDEIFQNDIRNILYKKYLMVIEKHQNYMLYSFYYSILGILTIKLMEHC